MLCLQKLKEKKQSIRTFTLIPVRGNMMLNIIIKTKRKDDIRILTHEEWGRLDKYFSETTFVRLGVDRYPRFRFMFNLLYYTGLRIGECLALTYEDLISG